MSVVEGGGVEEGVCVCVEEGGVEGGAEGGVEGGVEDGGGCVAGVCVAGVCVGCVCVASVCVGRVVCSLPGVWGDAKEETTGLEACEGNCVCCVNPLYVGAEACAWVLGVVVAVTLALDMWWPWKLVEWRNRERMGFLILLCSTRPPFTPAPNIYSLHFAPRQPRQSQTLSQKQKRKLHSSLL